MKYLLAALLIFALLATPVLADPSVVIETDKDYYAAGEQGLITVLITPDGVIKEAEIIIEVVTDEEIPVFADIIYTQIPYQTILNNHEVTMQVIYNEDISYFENLTARRDIIFDVPLEVPIGNYTINVMLESPDITLTTSKEIEIYGSGNYVDILFIIYILILVYVIYMLIRGGK
jgi:hypothetical protein